MLIGGTKWSASRNRLDQALELARKAVALDESDYTCQGVLGWALMLGQEHDLAERHHLKAYELNRNRASVLAGLGGFYAYQGKPIEGTRYFERAKPLDPFFEPNWYWRMLGVIHFAGRHYDEAIAAFSPAIDAAVLGTCMRGGLSCTIELEVSDAERHATEALRLAPEFSIHIFSSKEPYKQSADRERLCEGLRVAGFVRNENRFLLQSEWHTVRKCIPEEAMKIDGSCHCRRKFHMRLKSTLKRFTSAIALTARE